jgi:hypothetical protein
MSKNGAKRVFLPAEWHLLTERSRSRTFASASHRKIWLSPATWMRAQSREARYDVDARKGAAYCIGGVGVVAEIDSPEHGVFEALVIRPAPDSRERSRYLGSREY